MKGFLEFRDHGKRMAYDSGIRAISTVKYNFPNAFCTIGRLETGTETQYWSKTQEETSAVRESRELALS